MILKVYTNQEPKRNFLSYFRLFSLSTLALVVTISTIFLVFFLKKNFLRQEKNCNYNQNICYYFLNPHLTTILKLGRINFSKLLKILFFQNLPMIWMCNIYHRLNSLLDVFSEEFRHPILRHNVLHVRACCYHSSSFF